MNATDNFNDLLLGAMNVLDNWDQLLENNSLDTSTINGEQFKFAWEILGSLQHNAKSINFIDDGLKRLSDIQDQYEQIMVTSGNHLLESGTPAIRRQMETISNLVQNYIVLAQEETWATHLEKIKELQVNLDTRLMHWDNEMPQNMPPPFYQRQPASISSCINKILPPDNREVLARSSLRTPVLKVPKKECVRESTKNVSDKPKRFALLRNWAVDNSRLYQFAEILGTSHTTEAGKDNEFLAVKIVQGARALIKSSEIYEIHHRDFVKLINHISADDFLLLGRQLSDIKTFLKLSNMDFDSSPFEYLNQKAQEPIPCIHVLEAFFLLRASLTDCLESIEGEMPVLTKLKTNEKCVICSKSYIKTYLQQPALETIDRWLNVLEKDLLKNI